VWNKGHVFPLHKVVGYTLPILIPYVESLQMGQKARWTGISTPRDLEDLTSKCSKLKRLRSPSKRAGVRDIPSVY
jgi:hypothetical protein